VLVRPRPGHGPFFTTEITEHTEDDLQKVKDHGGNGRSPLARCPSFSVLSVCSVVKRLAGYRALNQVLVGSN